MMPFLFNYRQLVIVLALLVLPSLITIDKLGFVNIFDDVQKIRLILNIDGFIAIVTHMYLGDDTESNICRNITKGFSLEMDFDNPTDGFENPLGCEGLMEGTLGKKPYDRATANKKDEEINRLWALLCPKEDEETLNIVKRSEWGSKESVVRQRRSQAADFLIVNANTYTCLDNDYFAEMQEIETLHVNNYGDLSGNFWITPDGEVLKGVGWNHFNYVLNGGLGPKALVFSLIVDADDDEDCPQPSADAIMALRQLVQIAICTNKLSPHYSLIPYNLINDEDSLSSKCFERKELREWDWYRDNLDFLFQLKLEELRTQPVVSRFEWSGKRPKDDLMALSFPIEYLVVRHYTPRCFFNCKKHLKVLMKNMYDGNQYMDSNFIVAEDGRAYETEGWHRTWNNEFQEKKAVVVAFLGNFNSYSPHKNIFIALQSIIEEGLRLGELSANYKIVSMRTVDSGSELIGKILGEEIKKLDNYVEIF